MMIYTLSKTADLIIAKTSVLAGVAGPHVLDAALALALGTAILFTPPTQTTASEEPYVSRIDTVIISVQTPAQTDENVNS